MNCVVGRSTNRIITDSVFLIVIEGLWETECHLCLEYARSLSPKTTSLLNRYLKEGRLQTNFARWIIIRELKQRRRWRQRERQKSNRFVLANQLCPCITRFCTLLCRCCTTTTWNKDNNFLFLFLNFDTVFKNSTSKLENLPTFDEVNEVE